MAHSSDLRRVLTDLELAVAEKATALGDGDLLSFPDPGRRWERDFAEVVAAHAGEALCAQWALVRLKDSTTGDLPPRAVRGLGGPAAWRWLRTGLFAIERQAATAGRPVFVKMEACDGLAAALAPFLRATRWLLAVPLGAEAGAIEGLFVAGFAEQHRLTDETVGLVGQAAMHWGQALSAHRRLEELLDDPRHTPRQTANDSAAKQPQAAAPPVAVINGTSHRGGNGVGPAGLCAAAASPRGRVRLMAARLETQGLEAGWQALSLDALFRSSRILCSSPAEVMALIGSRLANGQGPAPALCCVDAASWERQYRFAGNTAHFVFKSRGQMVIEQAACCAEGDGRSSDGGCLVRLHSGDFVILPTGGLPDELPQRHALYRELAILMAKDGRRPLRVIAAEVGGLLREAGHNGNGDPALALLRAE